METAPLMHFSYEPSGVLSVELHAHSARSHDGVDPIETLLEHAQTRGLDALAVTDHDAIDASLRAADLAPAYGLVGIPGIEVSSHAGHVLALGVDRLVPSGLPFEETVACIHDAGGTAVVPHPFQKFRKGVLAHVDPEALVVADAIEVYNSRWLTGRTNRQARDLAVELGMPMTAGSDAHVAEMVGQAATLVDADQHDADAILAAICEGRTAIDGRRTPFRVTFRQAAGTARRRARRTTERYLR